MGSGGGGPSSFELCLEAYEANTDLQNLALQVADNIVNSREDAREVVGEALIDVCLNPRPIREFTPFFIRSVKNRALNWQRVPGNGRRCSLDILPDLSCDVRPDDEYIREEVRRTVHKALCALSEDDREVLVMRYLEERSHDEMAQRLGITGAAVRKRLERARNRLHEEYLQQCQ